MDFLVWVQKKKLLGYKYIWKKYSRIIDNEDYSGIKKKLVDKVTIPWKYLTIKKHIYKHVNEYNNHVRHINSESKVCYSERNGHNRYDTL